MRERLTSYSEFWPFYLAEHRRPATRFLHYIGTVTGLAFLVVALATDEPLWAAAAPVPGYGFAWAAHAIVERNRPATLRHPFWSLISDLRMAALMTIGRMRHELARYGLD